MPDQLLPLAQQAIPPLDSLYWLNLTSRVLHIFGAIVLVGGLFYLRAVVWPAVAPEAATPDQLFGGRRGAWAMWVGVASLLLLATGLWNFVQIIRVHEPLHPSYHMLGGVKILTGIALFFLAALLAGRSAAAEAVRRHMHLWLRVCLVLGLLTVIIGSVMRSYDRERRVDAPAEEMLIAPP